MSRGLIEPPSPNSQRRRDPPWIVRVAVVVLATSMPGFLLGASSALFFGDFTLCSIIGGLIGMLIGMTLEAPEPSARTGSNRDTNFDATGRHYD